VQEIYERTNGVPRRINLLCDRALLGAYTENKTKVNSDIVSKASGEVFSKPMKRKPTLAFSQRHLIFAFASLVAVSVAIAAAITIHKNTTLKAPHLSSAPLTQNAPAGAPIVKPTSASGAIVGASAITLADLNIPMSTESRDQKVAFKALAKFWSVTLPDGDSCQVAQAKNLHCYQSEGGIDELRQLDRPAILTLHDNANNTYYALLTRLSDANATLQIGGATRTVSLIELSRYFNGQLVTFWQAPQSFREKVRSGFQGDDVNWLAAQMAKLNKQPEPSAPQTYNKNLSNQVHAFQLVHGLPADGVVGPKTYMFINAAVGIKEPRLQDSGVILNASSKE
jgi:general secretion pathway protein A